MSSQVPVKYNPAPGKTIPAPGKTITILSIDGGGVRGIIPAVILEFLEKELQKDDKDASITDYFDVIAGTSAGAILTALLTAPKETTPKAKNTFLPRPRPRYSASSLVDFFKNHSKEIFLLDVESRIEELFSPLPGESIWSWNPFTLAKNVIGRGVMTASKPFVKLTFRGLLGKYNLDPFINLAKEMLGDTTLDETVKPVVIPACKVDDVVGPYIFSTGQAKRLKKDLHNDDHSADILLSDVVVSSAAAPTYFNPYTFKINGIEHMFSDGGMAANNPTLLALGEASQIYGSQPGYNNYLVLSLGTGRVKKQGISLFGGLIDWFIGGGQMASLTQEKECDRAKGSNPPKRSSQPPEGANQSNGWSPPIIDYILDFNSDMVDLYMTRLFRGNDNYLRIQDYDFPKKLGSVDETRPQNLKDLEHAGNRLLHEGRVSYTDPDTAELKESIGPLYEKALTDFVKKLRKAKGKN